MNDNNIEYNIEFYNSKKLIKNATWSFLLELSTKNDKRSKILFNAIKHKIGLLKKLGPLLREPHVKTIKGRKYNLKEIRVEHVTGYHRIFFCGWCENTYVILNHFIKKRSDTPLNEIAIAEKMMDEWIKTRGEM